jgi:hypothetical protein
MVTLDTLDTERCTFSDEISDECHQRVVLQAQLHAARAEQAAMEAEHDGLREAVLHLIEKGAFYIAQQNHTHVFPQSKCATITTSGHTADLH